MDSWERQICAETNQVDTFVQTFLWTWSSMNKAKFCEARKGHKDLNFHFVCPYFHSNSSNQEQTQQACRCAGELLIILRKRHNRYVGVLQNSSSSCHTSVWNGCECWKIARFKQKNSERQEHLCGWWVGVGLKFLQLMLWGEKRMVRILSIRAKCISFCASTSGVVPSCSTCPTVLHHWDCCPIPLCARLPAQAEKINLNRGELYSEWWSWFGL